MLSLVPLGILERDIKYKKISMLDISNQMLYYIVAFSLIFLNFGVWGPIVGSVTISISYFFITKSMSNYKINVKDTCYYAQIKKFGYSYCLSNGSYQIKSLIVPFIIAPLTSHDILGVISLASRISDSLNIFKLSLNRISLNALALIQDKKSGLSKIIEKATCYQIIIMGILLTSFVVCAPHLFTWFLSEKWQGLIPLIPFLAFSALCNNLITVQASSLVINGKNNNITFNNILQQVLFIMGSFFFIPTYGILGYGYALAIVFPAYIIFIINKDVRIINILLWFFSFSAVLLLNHHWYIYGLFLIPLLVKECRMHILYLYRKLINILWTKRIKL
jgi:PST family polysaccharide transporter